MKHLVTLEEYVSKITREKKRSKYSVLRELWINIRNGKLEIVDPNPPVVFTSYILRLDYNLWFWTSLVLITATCGSIYITDHIPRLISIRYVLGLIYVLFLPGYSLVEALYPGERDLTPLERIALSIGLSLALIPLIGLILNYTPWGIRLNSIVISISVFTFTMLITALYKKYTYHVANVRLKKITTKR